jgi:glycosyltransferase involved in cell wall biosynthesis
MNNFDYLPTGFISRHLIKNDIAVDKNNESPRISIVMPSFNQAAFIERSILSVINQGYKNLELIIIDGGSTDGTVDIIKKYEKYLSYWVSEKDAGQSDALNKGFSRASGEIYGWLNSDDLYLPQAFKNAVAAFLAKPAKKIVFGDWYSIDPHDSIQDIHHAFDFSLGHFKYEGFHLNAQAMFWRREVHKRFGEFANCLYNTMDYQMILAFGINEGNRAFYRIPVVLAAFRRYDGQKTRGFTVGVSQEHRWLASQYGYEDKYKTSGATKRLLYRFRRACWYLRRGGVGELSMRLRQAYGIHRDSENRHN